jgi:hypothetical protein
MRMIHIRSILPRRLPIGIAASLISATLLSTAAAPDARAGDSASASPDAPPFTIYFGPGTSANPFSPGYWLDVIDPSSGAPAPVHTNNLRPWDDPLVAYATPPTNVIMQYGIAGPTLAGMVIIGGQG